MGKGENLFNHNNKNMILRDHLSADRTILSAQRTYLAYIRTALTLLVAGVSLIRFFDNIIIHIIGWSLLPFALYTFYTGFHQYILIKNLIRRIEEEHEPKLKNKK